MKTTLAQADLRVRRPHTLLWEALMAELSEQAIEALARILAPEERAVAERASVRKYGAIYQIALVVQKRRKTQRTYIEIQPGQGERSPLVSGDQP